MTKWKSEDWRCRVRGVHDAILIAGDAERAMRHQSRRCARGIERTIDAIAQVENRGEPAPLNIGKHGIQRPGVAVDVGENGDG